MSDLYVPNGGGLYLPEGYSEPEPQEAKDLDDLIKLYNQDTFHAWQSELARATIPTVSTVAPWIMEFPDTDCFLYEYLFWALQMRGETWEPQFQKRGTCVGQGAKLACDIVVAVSAFMAMSDFTGRTAVADKYAGGRVDIGGRPGTWDGSTGDWVSQWLVKFGSVRLQDLDLPEDARDADERLATSWTNSREGVPRDKESVAKERPITRRVLVTRARECGKLIQSGTPTINCSNLIPTGRRDSKGYSQVRRSGGHCTVFGAVRYNPFGLLYMNSWGPNWGTGPTFPDTQPKSSVWVTEREADAILSQGDSYGFVGMSGLAPLPPDKIIL